MAKLNVGISGITGFIGSHLRDRLLREENISIVPFEDSYFEQIDDLRKFLADSDVVVHLAAMNRGDPDVLYDTNVSLVNKLVSQMEDMHITPHIIFSSSIQSVLDNPYGRSKKEGERIFEEWSSKNNAPVTILIIPNVYGDSGRPHYNSVAATFCYELTHGGKPEIHEDKEMNLIYINELTEIILEKIINPPTGIEKVEIKGTARLNVSELLALLRRFKEYYFQKMIVPTFKNKFEQHLYNVFVSYINAPNYEQKPTIHSDNRGMLFEIVKQEQGGQTFYSTTKPGIVRGNHYHTRKVEKFCVVQGEAIIRLRRIGTDNITQYRVSGRNPRIVQIPIFHTHNIENVGESDLHTLFWTNELYNPDDSDTFYKEV